MKLITQFKNKKTKQDVCIFFTKQINMWCFYLYILSTFSQIITFTSFENIMEKSKPVLSQYHEKWLQSVFKMLLLLNNKHYNFGVLINIAQ